MHSQNQSHHSSEQVSDTTTRRRFTPEYKLRILQEIDNTKDHGSRGGIGEILRREGLFASQVALWRNTLEDLIAHGLPEKKRGPKVNPVLKIENEAKRLEKENSRLREKLRQAQLIIEAQKKIAEMYTEEDPKTIREIESI